MPHLDSGFCLRLVVTMGHFLWQATAIALLAGGVARCLRRSGARLRYALFTTTLLMMAACPVVTFPLMHVADDPEVPEPVAAVSPRPQEPVGPGVSESPVVLPTTPAPPVEAATPVDPIVEAPEAPPAIPMAVIPAVQEPPQPPPPAGPVHMLKKFAPWLAVVYFLGVLLMAGRLMLGLQGGRLLRKASEPVDNPGVLTALARRARALGLRFTPAVATCARVAVPVVVGILRPMVLLPTSLTTGLTPRQVEAILTHELAHIRRYDPLVNLLQRVIESVLFFHPAVWFISSRISAEREHCCDDLAVGAGAERRTYAESLLRLAELGLRSGSTPRGAQAAVLGAADRPSRLRRRIFRLFGKPVHERVRLRRSWPVALTALAALAFAASLFIDAEPGQASPQPEQPDKIARLIEQLGDAEHAKREAAQKELIEIGKPAIEALEAATKHDDPEIATRAKAALAEVKDRGRGWGEPVDGLRVALDIEKKTMIVGEPFPVRWAIRNVGKVDRAIVWHPLHYSPVLFEIGKRGGKTFLRQDIRRSIIKRLPAPPQRIVLRPGQTKEAAFDLSRFLSGKPEPGVYRVTGVYFISELIPKEYLARFEFKDVVRRRIDSETIEVEIRPAVAKVAAARPGWVEAVAGAMPKWEVVQFDRKADVHVDSRVPPGHRLLLRIGYKRRLKPPTSGQQQGEAPPPDWSKIPHRMIYSHLDLLLVPAWEKLPEGFKDKIDWRKLEQQHFAITVHMGQGMGFHWFARGPLYWQDVVRTKLGLVGGEDRVAVLIKGLAAKDSSTASTCRHLLAEIGEKAVPQLQAALKEHEGRQTFGNIVGALRRIPGKRTTAILKGLYAEEKTRGSAEYALIHQPFRKGAKEEYLGMLRRGRYVYQAAEACIRFKWKEAIPILQDLFERPASRGEFMAAFEAVRRLKGTYPEPLFSAREVLRKRDAEPAKVDAAKRTIIDSPDKEAAAVIGISLATFRTKGPAHEVTQRGRDILERLPRAHVLELLNRLATHMERPSDELKKLRDHFQDKERAVPPRNIAPFGPTRPKQPAATPRREAKLRLVLDKPEYFLGENILLHYGLTNGGEKPLTISWGGDGRTPGANRPLRFKVVATDAEGNRVEDPFPSVMNFGGFGGDRELEPGQTFWQSLALSRFVNFLEAGTYTVRVYHDLGWDRGGHERLLKNELPTGPHTAPIGEITIKLVMPTQAQARQVVNDMLDMRQDRNASVGKLATPYADFHMLRQPMYLPIVLPMAERGDKRGLQALGAIETPEATKALVKLTGHANAKVASEALGLLCRRLPDPKVHWRANVKNLRRLTRRSWRAEFTPEVLAIGWKLLAEDDPAGAKRGARIIMCLGGKENLRRLTRVLDRTLAATRNDPVEQNRYPRPATACGSLIRAAKALIARGAKVPAAPRSAGETVMFMLAIGAEPNFRPAGWQDTAIKAMTHAIPVVRATTVENLPQPVEEQFFKPLAELTQDRFLPVQAAACTLAGKIKAAEFRGSLLVALNRTKDKWIVGTAYRAALACGVERDVLTQLCINRLDEPGLQYPMFECILKVVNRRGGWGYSQTKWPEEAPKLKKHWQAFLNAHREDIRKGNLFNPHQPPMTPDLFPRGFSIGGKNVHPKKPIPAPAPATRPGR